MKKLKIHSEQNSPFIYNHLKVFGKSIFKRLNISPSIVNQFKKLFKLNIQLFIKKEEMGIGIIQNCMKDIQILYQVGTQSSSIQKLDSLKTSQINPSIHDLIIQEKRHKRKNLEKIKTEKKFIDITCSFKVCSYTNY